MSGAAVVSAILDFLGGAAEVAGPIISGVMQGQETDKAAQEARGIARLARQDELKQLGIENELSRQRLGLEKQQLGLTTLKAGLDQANWREGQNKNAIMSALNTVGNAANNNAAFKNYLLSRWR